MAIRKIRIYPDPCLREIAKPVEHVDETVRTLITDMLDTLHDEQGLGLAATQLGVPLRILIMNPVARADQFEPIVFINPVITATEGTILRDEGCMSFPGIYIGVNRAIQVTATALDRDGNPFDFHDNDLKAHILQHELDHLNGKVFIDYLSPFKRQWVLQKLKKYKK